MPIAAFSCGTTIALGRSSPYENAFANFRASQRLWQGEVLALEAFYSRARTKFDGGHHQKRVDKLGSC